MNKNHLIAESIVLEFGNRRVLTDIHLQAETGKIIGILGHNGSGKSCLLKIIFGSLRANNKHIRYNGKADSRPLFTQNNKIKYLPQKGFLTTFIKVKHVMNLFIKNQRHLEFLKNDPLIKLIYPSNPKDISGGEKRYLESLLLLYSEAAFILLDEPFNKLSPIQIDHLKSKIKEQSKHKGIIITDHFYHHLWEISDQVFYLQEGHLKYVNEKSKLIELGYLIEDNKITNEVESFDLTHPESKLNVDESVFIDLEIFDSGPQAFSLFSFFDRTITRGGGLALYDIYRNPRSSIKEILLIQETVRFLAQKLEILDFNHSRGQLLTIENYLACKIPVTINSGELLYRLNGLYKKVRQKEDYVYLKNAISIFLDFILKISSVATILNHHRLPRLLYKYNSFFIDYLNQSEIKYLLNQKLQYYSVYQIDSIFRKSMQGQTLKLIDYFYELEALVSMAKVIMEYQLVFPEFRSNSQLYIEKVYHPEIISGVKNNFSFDNGENMLFLTGPNMAGKTTYLKSCGLCVYLAHLGMGVPAEKMELSAYQHLFTSLNNADSIRKGYSYFMSEALKIKELAKCLCKDERVFAIIDELFRGTNVQDAFEGSKMIISKLADWKRNDFLIASHLSEIGKQLENREHISFKHFTATIRDDQLHFNYQLKDGISNQRLGLFLLKNLKINELLSKPE